MFTSNNRENIINAVYSGRQENKQQTRLMGLIERHVASSRHRPKNENSEQITSSFKYFTMLDSNRSKVWWKAFFSLFHTQWPSSCRLVI